MGVPNQLASFDVECHEFGVQGAHEHTVAHDGHTAVVRAAAVSGDRTHFVLVVPLLLAGDRVNRINVVVRSGDVHRATDNDWGCLHGFQNFGLEGECRTQLADVAGVNLLGRVETGIGVICIAMQEIAAVLVSSSQLRLTDICLGEPG